MTCLRLALTQKVQRLGEVNLYIWIQGVVTVTKLYGNGEDFCEPQVRRNDSKQLVDPKLKRFGDSWIFLETDLKA